MSKAFINKKAYFLKERISSAVFTLGSHRFSCILLNASSKSASSGIASKAVKIK